MSRTRLATLGAVVAIAAGAAGCGTQTSSERTSLPPSTAEKLSVIDGNASSADFQALLDCVTATGAPGTGTELQVADALVASWQKSSKQDSLYGFSKAVASVYGC